MYNNYKYLKFGISYNISLNIAKIHYLNKYEDISKIPLIDYFEQSNIIFRSELNKLYGRIYSI